MKFRAPSINQEKKPHDFMKVQEEKSKAAAEHQEHSKRCVVPPGLGGEKIECEMRGNISYNI